jgi:hypothetical protein
MGTNGLSKQALSLIERSHMKIPLPRLKRLHRAYGLSAQQRKELATLYAFERLVEHTGEDREFAEAILSVIDPVKATSVYVIGGRPLAVNSRLLQEKAAEFLEYPQTRLIFLYPKCADAGDSCGTVWDSNYNHDSLLMLKSIERFARRRLQDKIQFHGIDVHRTGADTLALRLLSLCSPVTSTTIASSTASDYTAGYVYVEGPRDRWVLLKHAEAKRLLDMVTSWLREQNCRR